MAPRFSLRKSKQEVLPDEVQEESKSKDDVFDLPDDFAERLQTAGICASPQEATQVIQGYRDFMCLKRRFQDWKGRTLKPSRKIQAVWQQHILFMSHYQRACYDYHGRLVEYNPEEEDDSITYERKRQGTLFALTALCGAQEIDMVSWRSLVNGTNKPNGNNPKGFENSEVRGAKVRIFEAKSSKKTDKNESVEQTNNLEDVTTSSLCCF